MNREKKSDFAIVFSGTLLAFLLSKGLALVPALGLDDYGALHQDRNPLFYLWQGRFTQAIIQVILTHLGITPTSIGWPVIILFFGFASWAITLGIFYVAKNRGHALGLAAVGAIIASHPYLTEYFTFRESLITQGASFLLLSLVFFVEQCSRVETISLKVSRWIFLLFTMVFLAGAQQTVFIVLGFFLVARLVQQTMEGGARKWFVESGREMVFLYLLAAFCYVVSYALIKKVAGVPLDSRSSIIGFDQLGGRVDLVLSLTNKLLLSGEPVLSMGVKWYSYSIFMIFLLFVGLSRPKNFLLVALTSLVFYLGSIFLVSVSGVWWPVPRAVYGLGFALGISLLLVYINSEGRLLLYFPFLTFVAVAGLSFHSSAILYDQIRLNRWDAWAANNIAQDLIREAGNTEVQVVLVGAAWGHPVGLTTIDGDLNISALSVPWAANNLFMEVTGRKWRINSLATSPECESVEPWPKHGSIRYVKDAFYVCLGGR